MESSRIKNLELAAHVDEGQLAWYRTITPISERYARQITQRDYRGKRLAFWGHITTDAVISILLPLKQAGAEVVMGACNADSPMMLPPPMLSQRGSVFTAGRG